MSQNSEKNELTKSGSIAIQFFVTDVTESQPKDQSPSPKPSEKIGGCSDMMAKAGLPNPRYCEICGLGPCVNNPGSFMRSPDPMDVKIDPAMGNSFSIMSTRVNGRDYSESLLATFVEEGKRERDRQREREREEFHRAQDLYPKSGRTCLLVGGCGDGKTYVIHEGRSSLAFPILGGRTDRYILLIEEGPLVILYWDRMNKIDAIMKLMQGYDGHSRRG